MFDEREWVAATSHACFLKNNCALAVTVKLTLFAKRQSTHAFVIRAIWHTLCYFDNREHVLIIRDVYDDITGTPART